MSIFCSNTLFFAPECWKCTLRGPDFKIFPGGHAHGQILPRNLRFQFNACKSQGTFFPVLCLLQSFCHLFKILSKTLYKALKFRQNMHFSEYITYEILHKPDSWRGFFRTCIHLLSSPEDSGRSVLNSFDFNFWWHENQNTENSIINLLYEHQVKRTLSKCCIK